MYDQPVGASAIVKPNIISRASQQTRNVQDRWDAFVVELKKDIDMYPTQMKVRRRGNQLAVEHVGLEHSPIETHRVRSSVASKYTRRRYELGEA